MNTIPKATASSVIVAGRAPKQQGNKKSPGLANPKQLKQSSVRDMSVPSPQTAQPTSLVAKPLPLPPAEPVEPKAPSQAIESIPKTNDGLNDQTSQAIDTPFTEHPTDEIYWNLKVLQELGDQPETGPAGW